MIGWRPFFNTIITVLYLRGDLFSIQEGNVVDRKPNTAYTYSMLEEEDSLIACDADLSVEPSCFALGSNGVEYRIAYSNDSVAYNSIPTYVDTSFDIDKEAYLKECARTGRVVRVLDGSKELWMRSYSPEEVRENCKLLGDWLMKAQYYLDLAQEANVLAEEVSKGELRDIRRRLRDLMYPNET